MNNDNAPTAEPSAQGDRVQCEPLFNVPPAQTAERVVEDSALIPRHYASNIGYAACMMESSQSVLDRREAPILRKIAALLAAAPSPGESA